MATVQIYLNQAVYRGGETQDAIDGWYAFDHSLREVTPLVMMAVNRSENNYRANDPMLLAWEGETVNLECYGGDIEGTLETVADLYHCKNHVESTSNARPLTVDRNTYGTRLNGLDERLDRLDSLSEKICSKTERIRKGPRETLSEESNRDMTEQLDRLDVAVGAIGANRVRTAIHLHISGIVLDTEQQESVIDELTSVADQLWLDVDMIERSWDFLARRCDGNSSFGSSVRVFE